MWYDKLIKYDLVPDFILRGKIRNLLKQRLKEIHQPDEKAFVDSVNSLIDELKASPIAINTGDANSQHYELPTSFFKRVLGSHMKYSCGCWEYGATSLSESEKDMLNLTCKRAHLHNGQKVLELGCGWGSLSLFMAKRYPMSEFTVVSNSATQKQYIDSQINKLELKNLTVVTSDMNVFDTDQKFDRVVSVEMFEHMRNYQKLMEKINGWLNPEGKMFIHIFTHHKYPYKFEVKDDSDWMSKYFFTGGIMPSDDLLFHFNDHFEIEKHWQVNGKNYQKTAEAWLQNQDANKKVLMPIMEQTYGKENAGLWFGYWRIFFMACAELWGFNDGKEWLVSHYLLKKSDKKTNLN